MPNVLSGASAAAVAFYSGVAALTAGAMLTARHRIERRSGVARIGIGLVVCGLAGVAAAVIIFALGPRGVLPF